MPDAVVLKTVTKTFGSKTAVRDLDLIIPQGALTGFIGPNGAGKTTTIRMIMSIIFPDSGEVSVLGHPSALKAKDRIGYLPEERGVYKKMRVGAFLVYIGRLKGQNGPDLRPRVRRWLERVGLAEVERKRCEELSKGMQQKVQFIAAVIHEPDLLILDEPFAGLDPVNMRLLRDLVLEQHKRGATILFSTHVMAQAEHICRKIVMINDGIKVLDASLDDIRRRYDPRALRLEPLDPAADVSSLKTLSWVRDVSRDGAGWEIVFEPGCDVSLAMRETVAAVPAARVELHRPSLEDIFIEIVTGGAGSSSAAEAARIRDALGSAHAMSDTRARA